MNTLDVLQVAEITHEANKALCEIFNDYSQPSWGDAPHWQRKSAINGVLFHRENPNASPDESHKHWLKEKVATGWVYGDKKNPDLKQHPCIVPFDELPIAQQLKDYLFKAIVNALSGK